MIERAAVAEPEEADEGGVELANRDRSAGHDDRIAVLDGLLARERERLERGAEGALRQRPLRLERSDGVGEQARLDDGLDLRLRPRLVGRRGGGRQRESAQSDGGEAAHAPSIGSRRVRLESMSPMLVRLPQPYDFELSTARFDVYGLDRATSGARAASIVSSPGGRCGSRPLQAVSTSRRTTRRSRRRCSTSSGCRSISTASRLGGGGRDARPARDRARRLPPAAAGRTLRGARHLDHGTAGLASVGGGDQEQIHRALRRRRRARVRLPERERVARATEDELIGVGFSTRKAEYVVGLARSDLDLDELASLPDEEVTARLVALRGLGEWTADWFLARHLARPHAWPAGDLGLRKAVTAFYGDVPDVRAFASTSTRSRT